MQPAAAAEDSQRKGSMTRLFEYAVKSATSAHEIGEHEGPQILECWAVVETMQESSEVKIAKFKKNLGMKFGPQKGTNIFDLMIKKKDAAIRMVQHKQQQQKLHQMQQVQQGQPVVEQHSGQSSASNSQTDLQPSVPLQSSQQQQQPNNIYQFNPQHAPAQAPYIQQNHSFVPPGVNLPVAAQLQQQHQGGYMGPAHPHQQPGVFSTYNNSISQNSNMGGFTSQLGSGQLLTPINTVNVNLTDLSSGGGGGGTNMPAGYPGNSLGNSNPSSGPHPPQLGNGNNGMGGFNGMNMQANMAANMANNRPSNTMIFNSSSNPSGLANNNMNMSTNNISSNMNNSASAAANNAAKKPAAAKRTADKAGLENPGEKKAAKKRNPPAAKPTGMGTGGMVPGMLGAPGSSIGSLGQGQQGQGPQQAQVQGQVAMIGSLSNLNRPLNVPGGQSNMFAGLAGLSGAGIGGVGGASGGGHAQPPTVAQEIESMTERLNSVQEGIEPVGDNAAAAPLITPDFVRQEAELSRGNLRMSLPGQGLSASQQQQHGVGLDGQPRNPLSAAASSAAVELAQAWQFSNIADRGMLGRAAVQVLEGTDIKIGVSSLSALSNGIQQHLKNVLESAYKVSKSRANKTAINSYEGIYRMIVDHGKGNALPENTQNIAIRWGEDVRTILHAEEHAARKALKQYDSALEEDLNAKMRAFDEERARSGNKRKAGAEADVAWWTKEEAAEKAGLLGWSDLALVGFKNSVARKHELGNFAITGKRGSRPSTSSAVGVGLGAAKSVKTEPAGGGEPSAAAATAAAVAASASSSGLSSSLQFMLNHNHSAAAAALPAEDDTAPATGRGGGGGRGGAGESAAPAVVPEYTQQSCPLTAPRTSQVVLLEDDLAATLVRSTASGGRALPGGVLSTIRPTGTCLYKWKMGFYSNTNL